MILRYYKLNASRDVEVFVHVAHNHVDDEQDCDNEHTVFVTPRFDNILECNLIFGTQIKSINMS